MAVEHWTTGVLKLRKCVTLVSRLLPDYDTVDVERPRAIGGLSASIYFSSRCSCVCPAPGRSPELTASFDSPSGSLSISLSEVAWASSSAVDAGVVWEARKSGIDSLYGQTHQEYRWRYCKFDGASEMGYSHGEVLAVVVWVLNEPVCFQHTFD